MHLSPETALDFLEGRLENGQETLWKQHVEVCGRCLAYLSGWKQFLTTIKRSHLKSPTERTLERAVHIYPPESEELVPGLRCVLAAVIFDSFLEPDLAGARGASTDMRQLILQAEEICCVTAREWKVWPPTNWENSISATCPKVL